MCLLGKQQCASQHFLLSAGNPVLCSKTGNLQQQVCPMWAHTGYATHLVTCYRIGYCRLKFYLVLPAALVLYIHSQSQ